MLMRVAVGVHKRDIDSAIETYNLLSEKWFTHASPTLFNAGTNRPQLSRYRIPWHLLGFWFWAIGEAYQIDRYTDKNFNNPPKGKFLCYNSPAAVENTG